MSFFRVLPRAAAFAFAFAVSAQSSAYCLTYTCDMKKEHCPTDENGCNIGGNPLFWASSVVSYDVQRDGSKVQKISYDQLHEVVVNAFDRWQAADCGDGSHPSILLQDFGPVSCAKPEYNKDQPNQNVITFHDSEWPYMNTGAETLALTTVFFNPDTGEIYDANIELNSYDANFVLSAEEADSEHDDLNAVLTHEIGHFLGLSHSNHFYATMFQSYQVGMSTLEDDDIAAICQSLPPDRVATYPGNPLPDPLPTNPRPGEPRHGFSTECRVPDQGCCASTIGGRAPSSGSLALWAFGLGLVTLGARGRAKRGARARR